MTTFKQLKLAIHLGQNFLHPMMWALSISAFMIKRMKAEEEEEEEIDRE